MYRQQTALQTGSAVSGGPLFTYYKAAETLPAAVPSNGVQGVAACGNLKSPAFSFMPPNLCCENGHSLKKSDRYLILHTKIKFYRKRKCKGLLTNQTKTKQFKQYDYKIKSRALYVR